MWTSVSALAPALQRFWASEALRNPPEVNPPVSAALEAAVLPPMKAK